MSTIRRHTPPGPRPHPPTRRARPRAENPATWGGWVGAPDGGRAERGVSGWGWSRFVGVLGLGCRCPSRSPAGWPGSQPAGLAEGAGVPGSRPPGRGAGVDVVVVGRIRGDPPAASAVGLRFPAARTRVRGGVCVFGGSCQVCGWVGGLGVAASGGMWLAGGWASGALRGDLEVAPAGGVRGARSCGPLRRALGCGVGLVFSAVAVRCGRPGGDWWVGLRPDALSGSASVGGWFSGWPSGGSVRGTGRVTGPRGVDLEGTPRGNSGAARQPRPVTHAGRPGGNLRHYGDHGRGAAPPVTRQRSGRRPTTGGWSSIPDTRSPAPRAPQPRVGAPPARPHTAAGPDRGATRRATRRNPKGDAGPAAPNATTQTHAARRGGSPHPVAARDPQRSERARNPGLTQSRHRVTPRRTARAPTPRGQQGTTDEERDTWNPRHPRVEVSGVCWRGWGGGFSGVFQVEKRGGGVCAVSPRCGGALVGALWLVWSEGWGWRDGCDVRSGVGCPSTWRRRRWRGRWSGFR